MGPLNVEHANCPLLRVEIYKSMLGLIGELKAERGPLLSAQQDGSNSELKYASHLIRYNAIVVYRWILPKW